MSWSESDRRIVLWGASNFRDLGGYRTTDGRMLRWRRVFRSDGLYDLAPTDVSKLVGLGLGDVFDLRTAKEIEAFGTNPLVDHGVRHHHVPFLPDVGAHRHVRAVPAGRGAASEDPDEAADAYLQMLEDGRHSLVQVLNHAARLGDRSMVFHCTGGRDRAGLTAAILLSALGVPRDVIAADYELTNEYLSFSPARIERLRALFGDLIGDAGPPATTGDVMFRTLRRVDERYDSPDGFLDWAGFGTPEREMLRSRLLEE
ncbi:MAG: tyrosine-protein phosphatase [Myxococcota bacterium]